MSKRERGEVEILFQNEGFKVWVQEIQGPEVLGMCGRSEPGYFYDHYFLGATDGSWTAPLSNKETSEAVISHLKRHELPTILPFSAEPMTIGDLRHTLRDTPNHFALAVDLQSITPIKETDGRFGYLTKVKPSHDFADWYHAVPERDLSVIIFQGSILYWQLKQEDGMVLPDLYPSLASATIDTRYRYPGCTVVPYIGADPKAEPQALVSRVRPDGETEVLVIGKAYAEQEKWTLLSDDPNVIAAYNRRFRED